MHRPLFTEAASRCGGPRQVGTTHLDLRDNTNSPRQSKAKDLFETSLLYCTTVFNLCEYESLATS